MNAKILGTWTRIAVLGAGLVVSAASASQSRQQPMGNTAAQAPSATTTMSPAQAMGMWRSSFGVVKIEPDDGRGSDAVMGVWVYQRQGEEVVGFFAGTLRGNVLDFTWHEPAQPADLTGAGYLVFDPANSRFNGKWWTHARDRAGDWTGWRDASTAGVRPAPAAQPAPAPNQAGDSSAYGGRTYGNTRGPRAPAPVNPAPAPDDDYGVGGPADDEPDTTDQIDYDPSTDPFGGQAPPPPL